MIVQQKYIRASQIEAPQGDSLMESDGALKKDDLSLVPIRIHRVGNPQDGKFGPYALASFELLQPQDGLPPEGEVFVEGRIMRNFQRHFLNHKNTSLDGKFVKSPTYNGKLYKGWQFVDPDMDAFFSPEGGIILNPSDSGLS